MREIRPELTIELKKHVGSRSVAQASAYYVNTFRELLEHVAHLSYLNSDYLLMYRGQASEFQTRTGHASFFPTIYRGPYIRRETIRGRFALLRECGRQLYKLFKSQNVTGYADVRRRQAVQWAILQHYDVCGTPLLDFTQSLRVACSFAQQPNLGHIAYVYIFALPHITHRITVNSEHDLILVRLLSICPPTALRPYFQEGYLAGTSDLTTEYDPKSELDFNRRLVAKFALPTAPSFWGTGLSRLSDADLYPDGDAIKELCSLIRPGVTSEDDFGTLGEFVAVWAAVEQQAIALASKLADRPVTMREALSLLEDFGVVESGLLATLRFHQQLRNVLVHGALQPSAATVRMATRDLREILRRLAE